MNGLRYDRISLSNNGELKLKKQNFQKYLDEQRKIIDKEKWEEGLRRNCDPGDAFVLEWVSKYAKKFRKEYGLKDLKDAMQELKKVKEVINEHARKILELQSVISDSEDKIIEGIELLTSEKEDEIDGKTKR